MILRTAVVCALAASLAACGSQMDHGTTGGMDMGAATKSAKATLAPANATTGSGTATVALVKNQVHVDVRAQQLAPAGKYTAHLHRGNCAAIGEIIKTIGDLQADGAGAASVHLEYQSSSIPTPAFIDVHAAGGTEGPAVCGDLQANG